VLEYGVITLKLLDLVAISFEENVGSVRIIEKLGFTLQQRSEMRGKTVLVFRRFD